MAEQNLTHERLKEVLNYNPSSGVFTWLLNKCNNRLGKVAGCIHKQGYRRICVDGKLYKSSRLAFLYMVGYFPEYEAEHENRIRDDDRWTNLREATRLCNSRNRGVFKNNTSGVTGVVYHKPSGKYHAYIKIEGRLLYRGSFFERQAAVVARWNAEKEFDFPTCNTTSSAYIELKKLGVV